MEKSTVDEIRARFDQDVERFSNLETGQTATMDAALCLELVAHAAARTTPHASHVLDVGCGAGNFTVRLRRELPFLHSTLLDLSSPMLDRAEERVSATGIEVETVQSDVRQATFRTGSFDIVLAGAVLHHLRSDVEWEAVFRNFHGWLRPGGSVWVFDLVSHESGVVDELQRQRYRDYLIGLGGDDYAGRVLAYIAKEDTPKSVTYQTELLRRSGFEAVDVLHKNATFAAFGAVRS